LLIYRSIAPGGQGLRWRGNSACQARAEPYGDLQSKWAEGGYHRDTLGDEAGKDRFFKKQNWATGVLERGMRRSG
jgi:hypothetical protein